MSTLLPITANSELWCIHDSEADDFFNIFYNILRCMNDKGEFDISKLESIFFIASYRNSLLHKILTENILYSILEDRIGIDGNKISKYWLINYVRRHVKMGKIIPDEQYFSRATTIGSINYPELQKIVNLNPEFKSRYLALENKQQELEDDEYLSPAQFAALTSRMQNKICEVQVTAAWDDAVDIIDALNKTNTTQKHLFTTASGSDNHGNLSFNSLVSPIAFNAGLELLASAKNVSHALLSSAVISKMTAQNDIKVGSSLNPKNAQSLIIAFVNGILHKDPFITKLALLSRAWNDHIANVLSITSPGHPAVTAINKFRCTQFCPADLIVAIISSQLANAVEVPSKEQLISCTVPNREGVDPGQLHYSSPTNETCAAVVIQPHEIGTSLIAFSEAINTYIKSSPNYLYDNALQTQAEQFVAAAIAQEREPEDLLTTHHLEIGKNEDMTKLKLSM